MKRKKFVLIIDLCTCLLLIAMAWFCLYKGLYNFYNEYLEITAVEFLWATYSIIASVVYSLYIIPVDIKQIKEKPNISIGEKMKHDNCKNCIRECEHAGKDREFVCKNGVSCKKTDENTLVKMAKFIMQTGEDYCTKCCVDFKACNERLKGYESKLPPEEVCIRNIIKFFENETD